jgi:hypothetical protein
LHPHQSRLAVAALACGMFSSSPAPAEPAGAVAGTCYAVTGVVDGARLFTIDLSTGATTLIGPVAGAYALPAVAVGPAGQLWAANLDPSLYHVGAFDASFDSLGIMSGYEIQAMECDENGILYGMDTLNRQLVTIDPATAAVTVIAPVGDDLSGMAFDPTDGTLYASSSGEADVRDAVFTVDKVTGATTLVGQTGLGGAIPGLCFDDAGQLYAVKGGGNRLNDLLAIDKATGGATVIGSTGLKSVSGLAYRSPMPTAVPDVAAAGRVLLGARPSPFRTGTVIRLELPRAGDVTLAVHDVAGRKVRTLMRGLRPAGRIDVAWDGRGEGGQPVAAGVYLVRLDSAGGRGLAKVAVIR